jgi:hypothetical protein
LEDVDAVGRSPTGIRGYLGHYHADLLDRLACDICTGLGEVLSSKWSWWMGCWWLNRMGCWGFNLKCLTRGPQMAGCMPSCHKPGGGIGKDLLVEGMRWCREHGLHMIIHPDHQPLPGIRALAYPHESFYTFPNG